MVCSHCGRTADAASPPCPHCPPHADAASPHLPATGGGEHPQETAIDPEILPPEDAHARDSFRQQKAQGTQSTQDGSFRFAVWHSNVGGGQGAGPGNPLGFGGMGVARNSCLPGCVTLFLLLVCVVQFGILAALGFLFFHLVGSGLMLAFTLRQALQGRIINAWPGRVLVWCVSWGLAGWLSDGF